jgi:catechol 2,3-dioxygenase-like lactoylglutathione lyase family enzyme
MLSQQRVRTVTHRGVSWPQLIGMALLCCLLAVSAEAQTSRIKRISLMTPDLDQSMAFFTEVIGFTLDFEGTLPPGGEPFLGPVFNINAAKPIRRALLATSTEARGLFLIEHPEAPAPDPAKPTAVVTVVEVKSIDKTLALAEAAGAPVSETVTDVTPEGMRFSEAMITSPGGHAILVYELSKVP